MVESLDEKIQRAIQDGLFENLPGKGKPLKLDENPFEDPEWRLANKMLIDNGFTLPWIESRREIDAEIEGALDVLSEAWEKRQAVYRSAQNKQSVQQAETTWQQALAAFEVRAKEINHMIFKYNLEVPHIRFQIMPWNAERGVEKVTGAPAKP